MTINIKQLAGTFAENKDIARDIRISQITPALKLKKQVILDFSEVTGATQSFVHALISEPIREYGEEFFALLLFRGCNPVVQEVIAIVADYMQES